VNAKNPDTLVPDELVTLVDGTVKLRSQLTTGEAEEMSHWTRAKAERAALAQERRTAGLPPLCVFYDRALGEFCTDEGTHIGRGNEAGMKKLDFCERHLKVWFT